MINFDIYPYNMNLYGAKLYSNSLKKEPRLVLFEE